MFLEWLLLNQSIHLFLLSVLCNPHISHVDFTELGKLWPPFDFTLFIWVSFAGSKTSPWHLRIYVNGKANGRFLTMSFGKQWGYKLRKSCCLHTDLSLSATGVEGGQCNPKASVLNIESFSNLKVVWKHWKKECFSNLKGYKHLMHFAAVFCNMSFILLLFTFFCSSAIENGKIPNKYVKYTAEDLERMIGELFEGKSRSEQRRYWSSEHVLTPKRNSSKSYSVVLLSSEE